MLTRCYFETLAEMTWGENTDILAPTTTFNLLWDLMPDDEIVGSFYHSSAWKRWTGKANN